MRQIRFFFLLGFLGCHVVEAQTYDLKIGGKFTLDNSTFPSLTNYSVNKLSYGIQVVKGFENTRSGIESGIYLMNGALENGHSYRFLTIPFNYRIDFKYVYLSGGLLFKKLLGFDSYTDLNQYGIGYNLSAGFERPIYKKLNGFVEGRIAMIPLRGIFSEVTDGFVNKGLSIGVNYGF